MDSNLLTKLKQSLEEERDRLVTELKSVAKPDPYMKGNWSAIYPQFDTEHEGAVSHREEEEDEVEEYEARLGVEHSLESRLFNVASALERIKKETYGICSKCKKEIPLERLEANPAAEYHIEHGPKG